MKELFKIKLQKIKIKRWQFYDKNVKIIIIMDKNENEGL